MKKHLLLCFLAGICFTGCSCKKPTDGTQPPPVYDSRNVSRNAGNSASPALAVESNGTVHIFWRDGETGNWEIFYSCKISGADWTKAINLSNDTITSGAPRALTDGSDIVHVVWDELGVSQSYVAYTNRPSGGAWVTPIDISSAGSSGGAIPQIGYDNANRLYVIYDCGGGVWFTSKETAGSWIAPVEIGPLNSAGNPSLSVSTDGRTHVVFNRTDNQIMYMYRSMAGVWDSAQNVSADTNYNVTPSIAVNNIDTLCAAWINSTSKKVYVSFKAIGDSAWGMPQDISRSTGSYCYWKPQITSGPDGSFYMVWTEDVNGYDDVFYRKRTTGGSWSEAVNVSNTAGVHSIPCDIKVGSDGKVHICWQEGLTGGWANYQGDAEIYYTTIIQ